MADNWRNSILTIDNGSGTQVPCHYQTNTSNIVDFVQAVNNLISLAQANTSFSGTTTFENIHVTGTSQLDGDVTTGDNITVGNNILLSNNGSITQSSTDIKITAGNTGSSITLNRSGGYNIKSKDNNNSIDISSNENGNILVNTPITLSGETNITGSIISNLKLPYATIASASDKTRISTTSGGYIDIANNTGDIKLVSKSGKIFSVKNDGTAYIDDKQLLTKTEMMNLEHPIGSVYITLTNTNPNTILGIGTWQRIGNGLKLAVVGAANDKNGASHTTSEGANTDGEWSHAITVAETAQHNHTATCSTVDAHTHARGTMNIKGTFSGVGQHYGDVPNTLTGAFYRVNTSNKPSQGARVSNAGDAEKDDYFGFDASKNWTGETKENGKHSHTITIGNKGSGSKHNNIEPAFGIYLWKRTA